MPAIALSLNISDVGGVLWRTSWVRWTTKCERHLHCMVHERLVYLQYLRPTKNILQGPEQAGDGIRMNQSVRASIHHKP